MKRHRRASSIASHCVIDHAIARMGRKWLYCKSAIAVGPPTELLKLQERMRASGYTAKFVQSADGARLEVQSGYGPHMLALRAGCKPADRVALMKEFDKRGD